MVRYSELLSHCDQPVSPQKSTPKSNECSFPTRGASRGLDLERETPSLSKLDPGACIKVENKPETLGMPEVVERKRLNAELCIGHYVYLGKITGIPVLYSPMLQRLKQLPV